MNNSNRIETLTQVKISLKWMNKKTEQKFVVGKWKKKKTTEEMNAKQNEM